MATVDRLEHQASPQLFKSYGTEQWQSHVEKKCCELVAQEAYYKAESGAMGTEFESPKETVHSESLRILQAFVTKGGGGHERHNRWTTPLRGVKKEQSSLPSPSGLDVRRSI